MDAALSIEDMSASAPVEFRVSWAPEAKPVA